MVLPGCFPLADVTLHQTKQQCNIILDQVELQKSVLDGFLTTKTLLLDEELKIGSGWKLYLQGGEEEEKEVEGGEKRKPLFEVVASFLTGWGSPVTAVSELVTGVGDLLGQFASTVAIKERAITLPLNALLTATAGLVTKGQVHALSLGHIKTSEVSEDSVLLKLDGLVKAIQSLEEKRIRLTAVVLVPLNAQAIAQINSIAKLEKSQEILATEITAAKKRIEDLKVKKQQETDPAKKLELQKEIELEAPGLQSLADRLVAGSNLLLQEKQALELINIKLNKANAEVEVAANLVKTFSTFFSSYSPPHQTVFISGEKTGAE